MVLSGCSAPYISELAAPYQNPITMKSLLTLFSALVLSCGSTFAQEGGSLSFVQTKLISSTLETVPANRVWKITAVYGQTEGCLLIGACYTALSPLSYALANYTGFEVNGTPILSNRIFIKGNFYSNNTCTADPRAWTTGSPPLCSTMATDIPANPNILPFWLGSGNTLRSSAPGIFLSVIEFAVQ
jgi:hypothetical protein